MDKTKLNFKTKLYISSIIITALILAIITGKGQNIIFTELIFWIGVGIISESLFIALTNNVGVSVGVAVTIATIIYLGPYKAAICGAISIAFRIIASPGKKTRYFFNTELYKTAFNASQVFISVLFTGYFYTFIGGEVGILSLPEAFWIIPIIFLINYSIVWGLMSLLLDKELYYSWLSSLKGVFINCILVGFIGLIMALVAVKIDVYVILLFFGPLLIAKFSYQQYTSIKDTYIETINAFNKALEAKDQYTSGHSLRVQMYSEKLGISLGLPFKKMANIRTAAILHDIGKIGVDDLILRKPGKLTDDEFDMIKKHPKIGSDILKEVVFLEKAAEIIRSHHERYDGKGYPDGKKGDEIPIESAILSIADVFDAMTSDRPYRKALTKEEALEEIKRNSGIQFSPKIAEKFCEIMSEE